MKVQEIPLSAGPLTEETPKIQTKASSSSWMRPIIYMSMGGVITLVALKVLQKQSNPEPSDDSLESKQLGLAKEVLKFMNSFYSDLSIPTFQEMLNITKAFFSFAQETAKEFEKDSKAKGEEFWKNAKANSEEFFNNAKTGGEEFLNNARKNSEEFFNNAKAGSENFFNKP